jgi:hypothetical protein
MLQRSIRRLAIPAALLSLLNLASPVHAVGWGPSVTGGDFFVGAMQWVAGFLGQPVEMGKKPRGGKSDHGAGIDPDGALNLNASPNCAGRCEGGMEIDPNG